VHNARIGFFENTIVGKGHSQSSIKPGDYSVKTIFFVPYTPQKIAPEETERKEQH
jgi:hypothetical protein